jgi:hypothetical protein
VRHFLLIKKNTNFKQNVRRAGRRLLVHGLTRRRNAVLDEETTPMTITTTMTMTVMAMLAMAVMATTVSFVVIRTFFLLFF